MIIIPLQIEEETYDKFVAGILREHPIQRKPVLDEDGKPTFDENKKMITIPEYTNVQQLKLLAMNYLAREFRQGDKKIKLDADPIDEELIKNVIESNLTE